LPRQSALLRSGRRHHPARRHADSRKRRRQGTNSSYYRQLGTATIEDVVELAGPYASFQFCRSPADDHAVTFDLIKRARAAGARVLAATLDAPVRSKRPRDLRNVPVVPFRPTPKTILEVALSLSWLPALATAGTPAFRNMERYVEKPATLANTAGFCAEPDQGHIFVGCRKADAGCLAGRAGRNRPCPMFWS
jgi:isopentenyl diphosphate isomerase/L-lactate dehydrogenase-like FMN-dependent dehydrogenase